METNEVGMGSVDESAEGNPSSFEQNPIDIGPNLEQSEYLTVGEQSTGADGNLDGNRRKRGRPKGSKNRNKDEASPQASGVNTDTLKRFEDSVHMLTQSLNLIAVRVARTDDAKMNFMEQTLFESSVIGVINKQSVIKRVADDAPYVFLAGSLIAWGSRVAQLRQVTTAAYKQPTLFETPEQDYHYWVNNQAPDETVPNEPQGVPDPEMPDVSYIVAEMQKTRIS